MSLAGLHLPSITLQVKYGTDNTRHSKVKHIHVRQMTLSEVRIGHKESDEQNNCQTFPDINGGANIGSDSEPRTPLFLSITGVHTSLPPLCIFLLASVHSLGHPVKISESQSHAQSHINGRRWASRLKTCCFRLAPMGSATVFEARETHVIENEGR
jgi:hypothetical protein